MPKTKIVCTIGPASESREVIEQLIKSGMNVARLNFSHGSYAEHQKKISVIRDVSEKLGTPVGILQDLCGPKIRVGEIPEPGIHIHPGDAFILTGKPIVGCQERVSVSYVDLPKDVNPGDRILLADGTMELMVEETSEIDIHCKVINGGILTSHKGVNLPTGTIKADSLTEKDRADLMFGLKNDVDFVALSFVKSAADIQNVKELIQKENKTTPVIAKIEKHEALDDIDEIIEISDGIMVARGDLGVEIQIENVPGIQKMLVNKATGRGKPVIIATQMLRSMVHAPWPTRAEATDVANAVLEGADAVMLSEESAVGEYPVEAVRFMRRIIVSAEKNFPHEEYLKRLPCKQVPDSVAYASCVLADHLDAKAIVPTTRSGFTATQVARFRPRAKIIALSPDIATVRRLTLYWGCITSVVPDTRDMDEMIEKSASAALKTGRVGEGDLIIITAGFPVLASGTTNMMKVKQL
ncbi:pyruvate kinase [Thermodesulfobacteriota bacterium]